MAKTKKRKSVLKVSPLYSSKIFDNYEIFKPINKQVGGNHYKQFKIQPVEFIYKNNIGFMEGNAIKYLCRYKLKGGIEDLKKAKHYIEMLIDLETADPAKIEKLNKAKKDFYKEEDDER